MIDLPDLLQKIKPFVLGWITPFHPLTSPLTSTSWDGDAYSTAGPTTIDLSAVFSVPAGVKAVAVTAFARDSGSASGSAWLGLGTSGNYPLNIYLDGAPNDSYRAAQAIVSCDANGDLQYRIIATGSGTLDAIIQIWGYWI